MKRSNNSKSLHHHKIDNPFRTGETAVLDAWLLASSKYLILCASNLSTFSVLLNGNISFTMLNEFDGYTRFRSFFPKRNSSIIGLYPIQKPATAL